MNILAVLFSFSGRIGRAQYWLGYFVQLAIAGLGWMCLLTGQQNENLLLLLVPIIMLPVVLWMALAVMAKRYHDRDKSAWWILIAFIPIVGGIWQLIELGLLRGTDGTNDYGPDPCHSFNVADDIESHAPPGRLQVCFGGICRCAAACHRHRAATALALCRWPPGFRQARLSSHFTRFLRRPARIAVL